MIVSASGFNNKFPTSLPCSPLPSSWLRSENWFDHAAQLSSAVSEEKQDCVD